MKKLRMRRRYKNSENEWEDVEAEEEKKEGNNRNVVMVVVVEGKQ